jgi:hypothetical protein
MIQRLEEYHKQHGHSRVSPRQDLTLYKWTIKLRNNYHPNSSRQRRRRLSREKLQALERLDFVWSLHEDSWNAKFQQLHQYKEIHGHVCVPLHNPETKQLAVWVSNQRREYRHFLKNRNSTLTPERLHLLESIGFFGNFTTHQDVWNLRFQQLQDYYSINNHSHVPHDYSENYALGQWVMNLRTQYKYYLAGLPSSLTPARIAALEALDFSWNRNAQKWFSMLERLKQAYTTDTPLEDDLRQWVIIQRHLYHCKSQNKTSSMTEERIAALEAIPNFEWKGRASSQNGPSADDWARLFEGIRNKGITPDMPPDLPPWLQQREEAAKEVWTEEDLLDLWNQEEDEE